MTNIEDNDANKTITYSASGITLTETREETGIWYELQRMAKALANIGKSDNRKPVDRDTVNKIAGEIKKK